MLSNQSREFSGRRATSSLHRREQVGFFELSLVVLLCERTHQLGRSLKGIERNTRRLASQLRRGQAIHDQDPANDAVLAHEVLGRTDLFRLTVVFAAAGGRGRSRRRRLRRRCWRRWLGIHSCLLSASLEQSPRAGQRQECSSRAEIDPAHAAVYSGEGSELVSAPVMNREDSPPARGSAAAPPQSKALRELGSLFLRLGVTAFGGPAAHIAMMEDEVVRRKGWLSQAEFLDLLGITNLIPGPNSTEMAIHIGQRRGGVWGLIVAGSAFILPAASITATLAWAYVRFGAQPRASALLYGVKPVIIAIVLQALFSLAPKAVKSRSLVAIGILTALASAFGANELLCLAFAGLTELAVRKRFAASPMLPGAVVSSGAVGSAVAIKAVVTPFSLPGLFLIFAKIGSVLFGSGYVLLAFLRADFVEQRHWLSEAQLLDAIAVGQITPGPVFTTATFIGYLLGGVPGATLATLGIFLPAFVFVALSSVLLPKIRRSPSLGALLDGVNVASLALMAVVTLQLCRAAIVDWATALLAAVSALLLLGFKWNSTWLIVFGALVGLARQGFR